METMTAYTPHKFTDSARNTFLTGKPKRTAPQISMHAIKSHSWRSLSKRTHSHQPQTKITEIYTRKNLAAPKKATNLSQQQSTDWAF